MLLTLKAHSNIQLSYISFFIHHTNTHTHTNNIPRAEALQEKTAMALWALAGDNIDEKREMAGGIGVQMLIEFVNSMSENLHYIGSEGLGVLAQGPLNQQSVIAQANGIHPLVRLMKSNKEYIVLSVIKTLR